MDWLGAFRAMGLWTPDRRTRSRDMSPRVPDDYGYGHCWVGELRDHPINALHQASVTDRAVIDLRDGKTPATAESEQPHADLRASMVTSDGSRG